VVRIAERGGPAQKDDQAWVLLGYSVPLVLRKCEGKENFEVIGECYLHGYMNGEVIEGFEQWESQG
jgi:hypothetical protein